MVDLQARLDKLVDDASNCELISNLATDLRKRTAFPRLASPYKAMAEAVREEIDARTAVLKDVCRYRMLAELKQALTSPHTGQFPGDKKRPAAWRVWRYAASCLDRTP